MIGFWLAVAVLVAGGVANLALPRTAPHAALAAVTQAVAAGIVLADVVPVLVTGAPIEAAWSLSWPVGVVAARIDPLSAFFLVWSLPLTLLGTIYAHAYLRPSIDAGRNPGPHFALLDGIALSFVIVYSVQNALFFLLGWEVAAVAAWLLVIWDHRSQKTRFAGFTYLISTHVGLLLLVAAFMYLRAETRSMDFADFGTWLREPSRDRAVVFALLCASFALKSAFFPMHSWLPRAHAAAPAHVSALMSGVIHKAGLFAFLRFTLLMGAPDEWMGWAVLSFGSLSALFGALYTTSQRDVKRMLGYSSTENVGIAAMGFGLAYLGAAWQAPALVAVGVTGGLLHLLNHALFKCLLFYAAGSIHRATHTVDLERTGGLLRAMPFTGATFLLGGLAISGLPPLNGFTGELLLYAGLLGGHAPTPAGDAALVCGAALLAFVGATSALSITRAFGVAFLGAPRDPQVRARGDAPASMAVPMALHAAACLAVGLAPGLALAVVTPVTAQFLPHGAALGAATDVLAPAAAATRVAFAGLVGVVAVGWVAGRPVRRHVTWACGYTVPSPRLQVTASGFGEPFLRLFATLLPRVERSRLPEGVFPAQEASFETHVHDAVEGRIFEGVGRAEQVFVQAAATVPEQPRIAFGAGLVVLVILVGLALAPQVVP